ncbi:HWE histidine kinase domain-containing protein [Methylobacterium sp. J-068]|uniref:HWE histidine kinase domain-containing protein n=1 Tax=Methylobacterium sp. J-068 TaxID=2836649 RepID=UPI001FB9F1A1|nr:HWE histidine kinase domain-containing protein [Methylobacterium sp. J-068]MCJ2035580.1 PAS domain-containing protein [Methylobacterium sp. J-068]
MFEDEEARRGRPDPDVLLAAVEATGEAIIITSAVLDEPGPTIEYANAAFTRMTGYAADEVLGRSPRLLQGPLTDRAVLDRMRAAFLAGEAFQGEALNYRKDGTTYVVEWLITPLRDDDGRITRWVSAQRDITDRRAAEDRQALMVRELHHRVKNTLATVQAILNASLRSTGGLAEFRQAFTNRIASLAKTHALITEDAGQVVTFEGLLRTELEAYDEPGRQRVTLDGPRVRLISEQAVPMGMALHELATNAIRHGALGHPSGRLEVRWSLQDVPDGQALLWTWHERGGSPVAPPAREGFGSQLLNRVLRLQVGATVETSFEPDGLSVTVTLPLPSQK